MEVGKAFLRGTPFKEFNEMIQTTTTLDRSSIFMVVSILSSKMVFSNGIQLPDYKQVEEQLSGSKLGILPGREV